MSLTIVEKPAAYPVTLAEALNHMGAQAKTEDYALIDALIASATQHVEDFTGRAFVTRTLDWKMDCWPDRGLFRVPLPPLQSVTSIKYIDSAGDEQTWAAENYQVDANEDGGRIALAYGATLPSLRGGDLNAVTVRFVAGYGHAGVVPQPIRQAILLLVGHWYHERRPVGVAQLSEMPFQVSALLMPFKVWSFGA